MIFFGTEVGAWQVQEVSWDRCNLSQLRRSNLRPHCRMGLHFAEHLGEAYVQRGRGSLSVIVYFM